jgi:hypothetical protein
MCHTMNADNIKAMFGCYNPSLGLVTKAWARMTHLDTQNISYGQKKGQESNWQFDSRPLKVKNRPNFLVCRWCATYHWKTLDKGYNFTFDLVSIGGLHTKLWAPKIAEVPTLGILGLPFGNPRQNDIWVLVL